MKRSQYIDIISKIIHDHRRRTKTYTSDDIAKMIADANDSLGLIPPNSGEMNGVMFYEWEYEDETK